MSWRDSSPLEAPGGQDLQPCPDWDINSAKELPLSSNGNKLEFGLEVVCTSCETGLPEEMGGSKAGIDMLKEQRHIALLGALSGSPGWSWLSHLLSFDLAPEETERDREKFMIKRPM